MASLGQIIFCSMITLIILFSALIILILALTFSSTTPKVWSLNVFPIANIGEDKLLSCSLHREGDVSFLNRVSVTWKKMGLSGFVYQYENGAPNFSGQSPEFEGRTQIFPDVLVRGNGSLLLRSVRRSDEGVYACSIDSSDGSGIVNIHFRTAAFTAPTFTLSGGVLTARARRWFPEPKVKWLNEAQVVLRGRTDLTQNSAGIYSVVSTLQPVNASEDYTCQIKNDLVIAMSKVKITGINVSGSTYFILGTASSLLASTYLIMMTSVLLCMFYLT